MTGAFELVVGALEVVSTVVGMDAAICRHRQKIKFLFIGDVVNVMDIEDFYSTASS